MGSEHNWCSRLLLLKGLCCLPAWFQGAGGEPLHVDSSGRARKPRCPASPFLLLPPAVRGLVEQILKYGRVVRPVLGITIAPPQVIGGPVLCWVVGKVLHAWWLLLLPRLLLAGCPAPSLRACARHLPSPHFLPSLASASTGPEADGAGGSVGAGRPSGHAGRQGGHAGTGCKRGRGVGCLRAGFTAACCMLLDIVKCAACCMVQFAAACRIVLQPAGAVDAATARRHCRRACVLPPLFLPAGHCSRRLWPAGDWRRHSGHERQAGQEGSGSVRWVCPSLPPAKMCCVGHQGGLDGAAPCRCELHLGEWCRVVVRHELRACQKGKKEELICSVGGWQMDKVWPRSLHFLPACPLFIFFTPTVRTTCPSRSAPRQSNQAPTPLPLVPLSPDILDGCKVGETVKVEVLRRGTQRKTLTVTLSERQPEPTE